MGNLFSFISNPFESWLASLALLVGSAGIAIILFTIIIRLILAPLQIVQLRSARAMQRLQPHIADLRKKHGKDKQKLTEETMKLYREHKVNPAMGCLPMLLQFPVLIGLFWALRSLGSNPTKLVHGKTVAVPPTVAWLAKDYHHFSIHVYTLFHAHFLWLSNGLGQHDPLYILPILAGVTQWVQSRMMMQKSSDPQQQSMNMLMNFTPLIIVFFAATYPSGLSLYWVTSTLIGILVSVRITGWGSLPRFDQALAGRGQPARAGVSSRGRPTARLTKPAVATADIAGSATEADITPSLDGQAPNGDRPLNGARVPSARGPGRGAGRRRSGRPRGGRRG